MQALHKELEVRVQRVRALVLEAHQARVRATVDPPLRHGVRAQEICARENRAAEPGTPLTGAARAEGTGPETKEEAQRQPTERAEPVYAGERVPGQQSPPVLVVRQERRGHLRRDSKLRHV